MEHGSLQVSGRDPGDGRRGDGPPHARPGDSPVDVAVLLLLLLLMLLWGVGVVVVSVHRGDYLSLVLGEGGSIIVKVQ